MLYWYYYVVHLFKLCSRAPHIIISLVIEFPVVQGKNLICDRQKLATYHAKLSCRLSGHRTGQKI